MLLMKRHGHKLVLGLLLLTTMTSSLGVKPSSQVVERQPRQPINILSTDRYGKTSNVASSPSFDRLSTDSGSRMSPASTQLRHSISVAERTLPADTKQFPVKRRWNSGNLRVWGKRYSSAVPAVSSDSRGQADDKWMAEVPFWLQQSTTNKHLLTRGPVRQTYRRRRTTHVWAAGYGKGHRWEWGGNDSVNRQNAVTTNNWKKVPGLSSGQNYTCVVCVTSSCWTLNSRSLTWSCINCSVHC